MPKQTVLDPQGKTIYNALASLGYTAVQDVRQGKFFVLELSDLNHAEAEAQIGKIARDVLANLVIEDFRFEILD